MLALLKSLIAPLLSLCLMMMASGFFNTFISVRLELEGFATESIGIVTSALYLGVLIGSIRIDRLISKMGHIHSFLLFGLTFAILIALQSLWIQIVYWSVLRFFGGICMAGVFIVIESWLLIQSGPARRGAILSIYLALFYAALSLGQFLIDLSDPMGSAPFFITSAIILISLIPIGMQKNKIYEEAKNAPLKLKELFTLCPLGMIGCMISGIMLAVIYGLIPVYATEIGMSVADIAAFMALIIFGGFAFQLPLGKLADKFSRRHILKVVSIITVFLALFIGITDFLSTPLLYSLAFLFGGFSFTLYPLSMAYTCEKVKETQLIEATGGLVLAYGFGAVIGPLLAPLSMTYFGPSGLFFFLAAITLPLCFSFYETCE